jgi:hypothetical protein
MLTSGSLSALQELLASWIAQDRNKNGHYFTSRVPKMAIYGSLISAPIGHVLINILQWLFSGRTSVRAKVAQILVSNLVVRGVIFLIRVFVCCLLFNCVQSEWKKRGEGLAYGCTALYTHLTLPQVHYSIGSGRTAKPWSSRRRYIMKTEPVSTTYSNGLRGSRQMTTSALFIHICSKLIYNL